MQMKKYVKMLIFAKNLVKF